MISSERSGSRLPVGRPPARAADRYQRTRDGDALLLAAGQVRGNAFMRCWRPTHFRTWNARRRCCAVGNAQHFGHERDVLENGSRRNQLEVLEDEPDAAAVFLDLAALSSFERSCPLTKMSPSLGCLLREEQAQERRLARTARAGEEHELAFADRERQVLQRVQTRGCRVSRGGASRSRCLCTRGQRRYL